MASNPSDELDVQYYDMTKNHLDLTDGITTGEDALYEYDSMTPQNSFDTIQRRARYEEELRQIEGEIQTLRQVLTAKYRRYNYLKSQLGITVISELRSEVTKGVETLKSSETFQKTTAVVKSAKEKTSAALLDRWHALKQSNTFKSFEDKVGSAYSTVRYSPTFSQLVLAGPAVVGKLVRSATIAGGSPSAQLPTNSEKLGNHSSDENGHPNTAGASSPVTSSADRHGVDVSIPPSSLPLKSTARYNAFSVNDDVEDEMDEFVQAAESLPERGVSCRPATLAD